MKNYPYDIESRANRYLDGELSTQERAEFRELLDSSQEVRRLLHELELIRSTARSFPTLTAPDPTVESGLFQMIFAEDELVEEEEHRRRMAFFPLLRQGVASFASTAIGRTAMALPALLLLLFVGEKTFNNSTEPIGTDRPPVIAQFSPNQAGLDHPHIVLLEEDRLAEEPILVPRITAPSSATVPGTASADPATAVTDPPIEAQNKPSERPAIEPEAPESPPPSLQENAFADLGNTRAEYSSSPPLDELFDDFEDPRGPANSGFLSASYRHGLSTFVGTEGNIGQDMSFRVDGELAGGHRLSLSVGSSPLLVSERTYTLQSGVNEKGDPGPASVEVDNGARIDDELWAGIGYGYTIFEGQHVSLEAGLTLGLGTSTTRYGLELPARFSLSNRLDIEVVPTLTRVMPRDQDIHAQDSEFNPNRFGEEWTPTTTSIGLQAGISLAFGE